MPISLPSTYDLLDDVIDSLGGMAWLSMARRPTNAMRSSDRNDDSDLVTPIPACYLLRALGTPPIVEVPMSSAIIDLAGEIGMDPEVLRAQLEREAEL